MTHTSIAVAMPLVAIALFAPACATAPGPRPSSRPSARVITISAEALARHRSRTLQRVDRFQTFYDAHHARAHFMLGEPAEPPPTEPRLYLAASSEGSAPTPIREVYAAVVVRLAGAPRLRDCHALTFVVDGRTLPLQSAPVYARGQSEGQAYERVHAYLPVAALARLAAGTAPTLRLCARLSLSLASERRALRAFVAALRANASGTKAR